MARLMLLWLMFVTVGRSQATFPKQLEEYVFLVRSGQTVQMDWQEISTVPDYAFANYSKLL